ncbi:MAG TPA: transglutaminase-like cysteine peptidase [Bradyrhizobium sp.]|nr:transglutaminase-like cysteine peptidase [Bradyrhizobium sp.]
MSAFIRAIHAARIVASLFLLAMCVIPADDATARISAAKPPLAIATSKAIAATPAALAPPARFFSINRILAEHDRRAGISDAPTSISLNRDTVDVDRTPTTTSQSDEPFGLVTFRAPEGLLWAKWRGVEAEIEHEAETLAQCRDEPESCTSPAALRFLAMVEEARSKTGHDKLDTVNRRVNGAIRYTSDFEQHGVADLWSAPLATFTSGRGDCEDYAIAKYALLREAGVAVEDLRLLLVRDTSIRQDHAVLAVREDGRWAILDNRWTIVPESSEVRHLMPLFALDHQGVRLFATPYEARIPHESEIDVAPATSENAGAGIGRGGLPLFL